MYNVAKLPVEVDVCLNRIISFLTLQHGVKVQRSDDHHLSPPHIPQDDRKH